MNELFQRHQVFLEELACRPDALREDYLEQYGIPGLREVNLDVAPMQSGRIKISTITPSEYPWNGTYFKGIPIQIEAIADSGYIFSHWDANPIITNVQNASFTTNLMTSNFNFTANFIPDPTSGISQNVDGGMLVFPNPANNNLTIKLMREEYRVERVEIIAMDGKLVLSESSEMNGNSLEINCSQLSSGIYMARIYSNGHINSVKVTIRH